MSKTDVKCQIRIFRMDFYRNLKEKLSEELGTENGFDDDIERDKDLKAENEELSKRLSDNYNVYVRKLERRKVRIRELEDRLKEALDDNKSLHLELQKSEGELHF